jgi:hypothetical protein
LRSIDATLKELLAMSRRRNQNGGGAAHPDVASDRDLDGKYGDPEVKAKDPRDWSGPTMKGRKFSECDPAYLDLLATRLDYFAKKADDGKEVTASGKPKSTYYRLDAARARGWAARIRAGYIMPLKAQQEREPGQDDAGEAEWAGSSADWNA